MRRSRYLSDNKIRSLTITSKGQITISARARHALGLSKGDTLIELVVGNCIVLLPAEQILGETTRKAQEALAEAGVSVNELKAAAEKNREKMVKNRYQDLE